MNNSSFADELEAKIREEYSARALTHPESALGWRLLYSPRRVLDDARVAFIGFNPGGSSNNPLHSQFSSEKGSAYHKDIEDWRPNSTLQDQVIAHFERLEVVPEDVLAGNLVPFRSPSEKGLPDASTAITFGRNLWATILDSARPNIVISMSATVNREISQLLMIQNAQKHPISWGHYTATRGVFKGGTWIGLPHLSRFGIMNRTKSKSAIDTLFKDLD
jgi:hypothetical protein